MDFWIDLFQAQSLTFNRIFSKNKGNCYRILLKEFLEEPKNYNCGLLKGFFQRTKRAIFVDFLKVFNPGPIAEF